MSEPRSRGRRWPAVRLRVRAVVSVTMAVGWVAAAATGLVPYLLMGRAREAAGSEVLWLGRSAWMSLHVWMSVAMVAFTLVHVALNRRGVGRAARIVSGVERRTPATAPAVGAPNRRRWGGLAWVGVIAFLAVVALGGIAAARDGGTPAPGSGGGNRTAVVLDEEEAGAAEGAADLPGGESPRRGRRASPATGGEPGA